MGIKPRRGVNWLTDSGDLTRRTNRSGLDTRIASGKLATVRNLTKEASPMSIESHLAELERKHRALEDELADALAHPSTDDITIAKLKRRKLQVKDEISRLKHDESVSIH
jgi:hypothetical protein